MPPSIKITVPKGAGIDVAGLLADINAELDSAAEDIRYDLLKPTTTWSAMPDFEITTPEPGVRLITTDDKRYNWIDQGTDGPYEIKAKTPRGLRFGVPFAAKTAPRSLSASAGAQGNKIVTKQSVIHPGIDAREFSLTVAEVWSKKIKQRIGKVIAARMRKGRP